MIAAARGGVAAQRGLGSCDQVRSLCQKTPSGEKNKSSVEGEDEDKDKSTANEVDGR